MYTCIEDLTHQVLSHAQRAQSAALQPAPQHLPVESFGGFAGLQAMPQWLPMSINSSPRSESGASFGCAGPQALVDKLKKLSSSDSAAQAISMLTRSYEILELEAAQPELFQEGAALLAAGLLHQQPEAPAAYAQALQLVLEAVRTSEEALLDIFESLIAVTHPNTKLAAGAICGDAVALLLVFGAPVAHSAGVDHTLTAMLQLHNISCCAVGACHACMPAEYGLSLTSAPLLSDRAAAQHHCHTVAQCFRPVPCSPDCTCHKAAACAARQHCGPGCKAASLLVFCAAPLVSRRQH